MHSAKQKAVDAASVAKEHAEILQAKAEEKVNTPFSVAKQKKK